MKISGICNCHSGYISPDCSISIETVPSVDHIQNNGLCDTSKGACSTIHVYGHIIYQAKMIFCKIQTFYVSRFCKMTDTIMIINMFNV